MIRALTIIVLCLAVWGCGARTAYDNEVCQGADLLTAPLNGADAILTAESCSFVASQGGHQHRIHCDGEVCRWYVDDVLLCTCEELDYASTCGNGVPMCAAWLQYFDFSSP